MKAIVIHEYGGPEVLKYEDVPRPEAKEDQIRVRVIAAGVNPVDGLIRSGMFGKDSKAAFPMILGGDIAGVVDACGAGSGCGTCLDRIAEIIESSVSLRVLERASL